MNKNWGLSEKILTALRNLFAKYQKIDQVWIYGSRAQGNFKEGSDIDLVFFGVELDQVFLPKISIEIEALNTSYFYDLSIFHLLSSKNFIEHIEAVGQVFYWGGGEN